MTGNGRIGQGVRHGEIDRLVERVLAAMPSSGRRVIVAIAGAPGSGKSTLAAQLAPAMNAATGSPCAAVVPMDGFHLDNGVLESRGLRHRKGAPETFDGAGFVALVGRLRNEEEVVVPLFDRVRDIAVAGAGVVEPMHRVILLEGNYLLLRQPRWDALPPLVDLSVWLDVPLEVLEERLVRRWIDLGHSPDAARARALGNDIPNARLVVMSSSLADVTVSSD